MKLYSLTKVHTPDERGAEGYLSEITLYKSYKGAISTLRKKAKDECDYHADEIKEHREGGTFEPGKGRLMAEWEHDEGWQGGLNRYEIHEFEMDETISYDEQVQEEDEGAFDERLTDEKSAAEFLARKGWVLVPPGILSKELRDAAKRYEEDATHHRDYIPRGGCDTEDNYFVLMFKGGAAWRSRQGQVKEGVVFDGGEYVKFPDGTCIDLDPSCGLIPAFDVKDGDNVTIQLINNSHE